MRRRAAALAVPITAVLLAVAGCGSIPEDWKRPAFMKSDEEKLDGRLPTVTGAVGKEPKVDFGGDAPPDEQLSGVVEKGGGEGELIRSDDMLLTDIVEYQWTAKGKAKKTQSTYDTGSPIILEIGQMPEELTKDLVDQPIGSRVLFTFPPQDPAEAAQMGQPSPAPGASVSIMDIKGRFGKGDTVSGEQTKDGAGKDMPVAKDAGPAEPKIEIPKDTKPPKGLETVPLIEGDGPEIKKEQQIVVQYTGVRWDDGKVFDSTWTRGGTPATFPIGVGQVVKGWDEGLVGQKVGSRVMLVIPEAKAYGKDAAKQGSPAGTLVFVIDLLGAVDTQPPPEEEAGAKKDDEKEKDEEKAE